MTFEEIRIAVGARMATWTDAPVESDGWQRSAHVQKAIDTNQPWVRIVIQHGDSFTAAIGTTPCVRRTGLIMCQVFTEENQGSRTATLLADSLSAHLEHYQDGSFATRSASVRRVGPSNGFYQLNVSVPFVAD